MAVEGDLHPVKKGAQKRPAHTACTGGRKHPHYSSGKKKGAGNTKNGNAYLVWAFIGFH
ncbi:hypothetical protein [Nitrosospira sp. Nsp11]|uniref:hypothetical protein n=1 Tax=Nitrosospira sp. Nsp11 TaxID=1855338 RepID=UPI0015B55CD3|nr:hypothetical protein [Nitrosospira sp. Nsp11]